MNISVLTYGSRGDVQPLIHLARGLMDNGHKVILAAPARFAALINEYGVPFVLLAGDPEDLSRRLNNAGYNFLALIRELKDHSAEVGAQVLRQTEEVCKDADLIIHTFAHAVGAHTLALEKNIPDVHIQLFPMFAPTGDYPNIALPDLRISVLNRFSHQVAAVIALLSSKSGFEQVRRRTGLPKRKLFWPFEDKPHRLRTPILCAWSPCIIPASADWPPRVHATGYFFSSASRLYDPPVELDSFLRMGRPPVCVTFGSMVNRDFYKIDQVVRDSLRQTDNRGVVLSGWGGVKNQNLNDLLYVESVPHDWLLPKCKMIIHHGGAGTTSAGLRAGIPQVVIPFTADQPFWGNRVYAIGAGPKPILVKNISSQNLVQAIARAESSAVCERAQVVGQRIRSEEGVSNAVRLIELYARSFRTDSD